MVLGGHLVPWGHRLLSSQMTGPPAACCLVKLPCGIGVRAGLGPAGEAPSALSVQAGAGTVVLPSWSAPVSLESMRTGGICADHLYSSGVRVSQCKSVLPFRTFYLAHLASYALQAWGPPECASIPSPVLSRETAFSPSLEFCT